MQQETVLIPLADWRELPHPLKKNIPIKMDSVGNDEYEMLFYADAVLDEDYFGEGICRWQPENFGASFKATGKAEETEFNISDVMENLTKTNTLTKYYWKGAYPYLRKEDGSIYDDGNTVSFGCRFTRRLWI